MNEPDPRMDFFRQVFGGAWITQALSVAAELGVADVLAAGPCATHDLAARTGAHAGSLGRLMRALASVGVFAEDAAGRWMLSPLADLLRSDVPGSQRAFATMMGAEFDAAWGELLHSVRTGEPGFERRFGRPFFRHMEENPARHAIYDLAMTGVHGRESGPVLEAYDFGAFRHVVDVGGGNGLNLAAILARHPALRGTLFDLPSVADRARTSLAASPVAPRLRIEGGDFFAAVPAGGDAYVLRHIVHDWQDAEAATILRRCREAMAPGGRVLVVEMVVPPANEPGFGKWLDLMMLLVGGRERTRDEYERLFAAAGLRLARVVPTSCDVSVLEGVAG
jgi:hypothetical protein